MIGGGVFNQIYAVVGQGKPLTETRIPELMYTAVLPYLEPEAALEELKMPAPED